MKKIPKAIAFTLICSIPSLVLLLVIYLASQVTDFKVYGSIANVIMIILLGCLAFSITTAPFIFFQTTKRLKSFLILSALPVMALVIYGIILLFTWPPNYI